MSLLTRTVAPAVSLGLAVLVLAGVSSAQTTTAVTPEMRRSFAETFRKQPRSEVNIPPDGAKVVIVKFNDYECPGCRDAERSYRPVLEKFAKSNPKAVKYVVKDWPWNSACNFNSPRTIPGHEASCDAAVAARAARERGKFQAMTDWLWANQGATPAAVRAAAERLIGLKDFDKEASLKLPEIRRDIADGGALRVDSTPTYFVNGVRLPGTLPPELFELAISLELNPAAR
jgi:protein-disulfide isomerase